MITSASAPVFSEAELEAKLSHFADSLSSPVYNQVGLKACRKVLDRLMTALDGEESDFVICSTHIGGTLARGSDVLLPEFDLILYIIDPNIEDENKLFSLPYFLELAEEILIQHHVDLKILPGGIARYPETIRFSFVHGIKVTLRPTSYYKVLNLPLVRAVMVLERRENFFRTNLQNPYVQKIVRLIKIFHTAKCNYFFGVNEDANEKIRYVIELVSVAVAFKEEAKSKTPSILKALKSTLHLLLDLNTLKVGFAHEGNEKWKSEVSGPGLKLKLKRLVRGKWTAMIGDDFVKMPTFAVQQNFVMDPGNSNEDLLKHLSPSVTEKVKKFAVNSLQRLQQLCNNTHTINYYGNKVINYHDIFGPMPISTTNTLQPMEYALTFEGNYPFVYAYVEVSDEVIFSKSAPVRAFVYLMKDILQLLVKSVAGQELNWRETGICLERTARQYGKLHIKGAKNIEIYERDAFDVDLYVPYGSDCSASGYKNRVIRLSMNWAK